MCCTVVGWCSGHRVGSETTVGTASISNFSTQSCSAVHQCALQPESVEPWRNLRFAVKDTARVPLEDHVAARPGGGTICLSDRGSLVLLVLPCCSTCSSCAAGGACQCFVECADSWRLCTPLSVDFKVRFGWNHDLLLPHQKDNVES